MPEASIVPPSPRLPDQLNPCSNPLESRLARPAANPAESRTIVGMRNSTGQGNPALADRA